MSVREKFNVLYEIWYTSSFVKSMWSLKLFRAAAAAVKVCLSISGLWKIPGPLLRSYQRDEVNVND